MGLQLEKGTQFPMRPGIIRLTAGATLDPLPTDSPDVDWTAAGTKITVAAGIKAMDDELFSISGGDLVLPAGQYKIHLHVEATSGGSASVVSAACTDTAGTTVHCEGFGAHGANANKMTVSGAGYVHLPSGGTLRFRAASGVAAARIDSGDPIATVEKVGNANETV